MPVAVQWRDHAISDRSASKDTPVTFARQVTLATISLCALAAAQAPAPAASAQGRPTWAAPAKMDYAAMQEATEVDDSGTMRRADKDMGRVIAKLQELGAKPLGTQSVIGSRAGPTLADAVKALLKESGQDPDALMAQMKVKQQGMSYRTPGGSQPIRIYTPEGQAPQDGWPIIVYYHGGGWVIANLDTYDASAMALAKKANAVVASVEYSHAPEHKFPAAHEDALIAYKWVISNAGQFGGNPQRLALAGESAGGNLAANVAIAARDQGLQSPEHMLLVYPVAGTALDTPSYKENANAVPLSRQAMEWLFNKSLTEPEDMQDPRLDIVGRADLRNLPDATVITAEIDPLMSEGKALADKLKAAGSKVTYQNFEGVTHGFFGMAAVVTDAEKAQFLAARELKEALAVKTTNSTGKVSYQKQ